MYSTWADYYFYFICLLFLSLIYFVWNQFGSLPVKQT